MRRLLFCWRVKNTIAYREVAVAFAVAAQLVAQVDVTPSEGISRAYTAEPVRRSPVPRLRQQRKLSLPVVTAKRYPPSWSYTYYAKV